MSVEFVPLSSFGLEPAAEVLARGFDDYFVKLACSATWLLHLARNDSVDLAASRVVRRDGNAVGAALIARRGWTSRVAGMALVPEARGQGTGAALMQHLMEAARLRGDRGMVLEVIEANARAVKLYERCGFHRVRRLVSFSRSSAVDSTGAAPAATPEQVDPRVLAAVVARDGLADLPWQLAAETLAHMTPPSVAYRLDGAWLAVANLATPEPFVRAVVTERAQRGRGQAKAILAAVAAAHPGKTWRMSALWPEELAGVFTSAGFQRAELSQWQMARALG